MSSERVMRREQPGSTGPGGGPGPFRLWRSGGFLDRSPGAGNSGEFDQTDALRSVAGALRDVFWAGQGTPGHEPVFHFRVGAAVVQALANAYGVLRNIECGP